MDPIERDFVYEFAKDLRNILDQLKKDQWYYKPYKSEGLKEKLFQESSILVQKLYNRYRPILDLKLHQTAGIKNIELRNATNESILIPKSFIIAPNSKEIEENFVILLLLMKNRNLSWEDFEFRLTQLFSNSDNKVRSIKSETIEKIRFFMSFIKLFPEYVTENVPPNESKKIIYRPKYYNWKGENSYYKIFNNYLISDFKFFKHNIRINPIPNYPIWNLQLAFCDQKNLENIPDYAKTAMYPLQVIENLDNTFSSILFLMDKKIANANVNLRKYINVEKFSILNNFNVFNKPKLGKKTKLELPSAFESFVEFINDYNTNKEECLSKRKTYEFIIDFTKKTELDENINSILTTQTIKKFNLYYREKNDFNKLYSKFTNSETNPYRTLFFNRYSFPNFNSMDNFFVIIRKKRNVLFTKTIEFIKLFSYQTFVYELREKVVIYGFLSDKSNFNTNLEYILGLLDNLNTDYKFLLNNTSMRQSTLSLYNLPNSNQFSESSKTWQLAKHNLILKINQKEEIYSSQVQSETLT